MPSWFVFIIILCRYKFNIWCIPTRILYFILIHSIFASLLLHTYIYNTGEISAEADRFLPSIPLFFSSLCIIHLAVVDDLLCVQRKCVLSGFRRRVLHYWCATKMLFICGKVHSLFRDYAKAYRAAKINVYNTIRGESEKNSNIPVAPLLALNFCRPCHKLLINGGKFQIKKYREPRLNRSFVTKAFLEFVL